MARHHSSKAVYRAVSGRLGDGDNSERAMENRDGSMLSQEPSAMAGMPRGVRMEKFPMADYDLDGDLKGNIVGIDNQMRKDHAELKKSNKNPRKI